jgi:hypothetical protein
LPYEVYRRAPVHQYLQWTGDNLTEFQAWAQELTDFHEAGYYSPFDLTVSVSENPDGTLQIDQEQHKPDWPELPSQTLSMGDRIGRLRDAIAGPYGFVLEKYPPGEFNTDNSLFLT